MLSFSGIYPCFFCLRLARFRPFEPYFREKTLRKIWWNKRNVLPLQSQKKRVTYRRRSHDDNSDL